MKTNEASSDGNKTGDIKRDVFNRKNNQKENESYQRHDRRRLTYEEENPTKMKISKKDFFSHLIIVLLVVGIFISKLAFQDIRNAQRMKQQKDILDQVAAQHDNVEFEPPPIPQYPNHFKTKAASIQKNNGLGCKIYLAQSSLPGGNGLGLFTATPFMEKEVIIPRMEEGMVNLKISHPYLFIMKHHHVLANVKEYNFDADASLPSLLASKPIEKGEELFFDLNDDTIIDAPSILDDIPTKESFDKVDKIIHNLLESIPMKETTMRQTNKRKRNHRSHSSSSSSASKSITIKEEPIIDSAPLLKLLKETLHEYDTKVSALIPSTDSQARSMMQKGSALYLSNKRSIEWIEQNGFCIDGLYPKKSTIPNADYGAFTLRDVKKGDVIITAPIFVKRYRSNKNNKEMMKHCFRTSVNVGLLLCPMSFAMFINHGVMLHDDDIMNECSGSISNNNSSSSSSSSRDDDNDMDERDEEAEKYCGSFHTANAYYEWSEFNSLTDNLDEVPVLNDLLNKMTGLTIDIIASRDIMQGEEIFIDYLLTQYIDDAFSEDFVLNFKDEMIPQSWKN